MNCKNHFPDTIIGELNYGVEYVKPRKGIDYFTPEDIQEVVDKVEAEIDLQDYYTKEEVDEKLKDIELDDYYTKEEVDTQAKDYLRKEDVDDINRGLVYDGVGTGTFDMAVNEKTRIIIESESDCKFGWISGSIPVVTNAGKDFVLGENPFFQTGLSATKWTVEGTGAIKVYKVDAVDLSNYYTKAEVDSEVDRIDEDLLDHTKAIADNVARITKAESDIESKQDALTAGTNIVIDGSIISALGITEEKEVYIGSEEPTDSAVKLWVDTDALDEGITREEVQKMIEDALGGIENGTY